MSRRLALSLSLLLGAGACSTETEVVEKTVKGTAIEHGEALFSDEAASPSTLNAFSCATCHVAEPDPKDTRILSGAPLAGAVERPSFWGGQENDLLRSINACRYNFMEAQKPWTTEDEDARAMYAYLESLPKSDTGPQPFTVVGTVLDLMPGDAGVGGKVYVAACQSCHGAAHTALGRLTERAPRLPEQAVLEHAEYSFDEQRLVFIEKIRHGPFYGYGGSMPPFSKEVLPDEELAGLLAYMGLYQK